MSPVRFVTDVLKNLIVWAGEKWAGGKVVPQPRPHKRHTVQARPIGERPRRHDDDAVTPVDSPRGNRDGGSH